MNAASQIALYCQNPIGTQTKTEFLQNGVVLSTNTYTLTNQLVPVYVFAAFNPQTGFSDHWYIAGNGTSPPAAPSGSYGNAVGPVFYVLKNSISACSTAVNTYLASTGHHVTTTRVNPAGLTLQGNLGYLCNSANVSFFSQALTPMYEAYYQTLNKDSMIVRGLSSIQTLLNAGWTGSPQANAPVVGYSP
jgi:hypothetical protein